MPTKAQAEPRNPERKERSFLEMNTEMYNRVKSSPNTFSLYGKIEDFDLDSFKFFGSFYNERLEIYQSIDVAGSMGGAPIEEYIVYFFDGVLVRTQYLLKENAANFLLNRMRVKPVIRSGDEANISIIRNGKIVDKVENRLMLNEDLTVYELEWDLKDREVLLRVDERPIEGPDIRVGRYLYISQVTVYEALLEGHFSEELI